MRLAFLTAVKYQHFINDIRALGDSLERLSTVLQQYERQYPRREWHSRSLQIDAADSLWPQLTGDFYQTLKECDTLLARHGHLRNGRPRITSNLRWWMSAEGAVDNLIARLRFHTQKVEFYSAPSQFDAVIRHGRDLQQLRRQVANLERMMIHGAEQSSSPWSDVLPPSLEAKFGFEFDRNRPSWSLENMRWPLKESFEAFTFHFARGTVKFSPSTELGNVPDLVQHLNLAKSVWILEKIRQSSIFRAANTESRWADYMREFEDDLRGQLNRFEIGELCKPPEQQLLELPGSEFAIKTGEETNAHLLDAGTAGPLEEMILQVDLISEFSDRESSLSVFRETDSDFRFMTSTRRADSLTASHDQDVEIDMDRHRLVPAYANPTQASRPRHNLLVFNEKGKKPKVFDFLDSKDVKKLQRALTGFRVHHDMPVSRWCINGSERPGDVGRGMLQLWQFKPLPPISSSLSPTSDTTSSSEKSRSSAPNCGLSMPLPVMPSELAAVDAEIDDSVDFLGWPGFPNAPAASGSTRSGLRTSSFGASASPQYHEGRRPTGLSNTTRYSGTQASRSYSFESKSAARPRNGSQETQNHSRGASGTTAATRTSVMSPVKGPRGDGIELVKPQLPALVIFTICSGKYSFLHLIRKPLYEDMKRKQFC